MRQLNFEWYDGEEEVETALSYTEFVRSITKPGQDIKDSLTPEKCDMWHMATGISGEAGELLDAIKKHVVYNKPLDTDNVREELGDLLFYMTGLAEILGTTLQDAKCENREKLEKRYSQRTYTDTQAIERKDKSD